LKELVGESDILYYQLLEKTMNFATELFAKASHNAYTDAVRASAEKLLGNTQTTLSKAQSESTIRLSKLAQKNLLVLAKGANQLSVSLTELSDKLEPATKPAAAKAARKPAAKKPVVKAAAKSAKPVAVKAAKAPKAVKEVAVVAEEALAA
jgi:hypothetical protein